MGKLLLRHTSGEEEVLGKGQTRDSGERRGGRGTTVTVAAACEVAT